MTSLYCAASFKSSTSTGIIAGTVVAVVVVAIIVLVILILSLRYLRFYPFLIVEIGNVVVAYVGDGCEMLKSGT